MKRIPLIALVCAMLAGCGGMNVSLWPFGGEKAQERPRTPANATEYQCLGGKRFYVRQIDNGAAAWVILPDREVRLDKVGGGEGGARYSNGIAVLEINGSDASLNDGPAVALPTCKATSAGT